MKTICRLADAERSPADLLELRRQLDGWRRSQTSRSRLPEELWVLAASLARIHGVSLVARSLGLSYYKLRQRLAPAAPAEFVELRPLAAASPGGGACVVELSDGSGGWMTIRLSGEGAALLGLAEAFWRRGR
jgi:hypothetical protein